MFHENLRIFGAESGIFVLFFDGLQITSQFLVPYTLGMDSLAASVFLLCLDQPFILFALLGGRNGLCRR